jgi:cytochrome P450
MDTTSATMAWGLKFLSDNQSCQSKLQRILRQSYQYANTENRNPTCHEISQTHIPYLDCVIEETLRLCRTTGGVQRQALVDTEILGHKIPKGTDVFLMGNGASF